LIWNKEEFPHKWNESIVIPIHREDAKTECSNYRGISLLPSSYKMYPTFFSLGQFLMQMKLLEITNMDFDAIGQGLIRSSIYARYWRKVGV
jgi:uncharacterized membrane protein